jgi:hypothetical protein
MTSIKVEEKWGSYSVEVLHEVETNSVQYIESRRAFYAGAAAMLSLVGEVADHPDEIGIQMLSAMRDELRRFNDAVKGGKA